MYLKTLKFELPYPPTINGAYKPIMIRKKPRIMLSQAARDYKVKAYLSLLPIVAKLNEDTKAVFKSNFLEITVLRYPPDKRRRDPDNIKKFVYDALMQVGLIEDDSKIIVEHSYLKEVVSGGKIGIELSIKEEEATDLSLEKE
jgi:crossover junction endodeoxyribonuclease RusA